MTIGTSTPPPSTIGNIGLPAERSSTTIPPEIERALSALPTYLPAFKSSWWDDPDASEGGRCFSSRSRGSARASLPIKSRDSYRMISVESGLNYNWAVAIDGLLRPNYFVEQPKAVDFFDVQSFRRMPPVLMRAQLWGGDRRRTASDPLPTDEKTMWVMNLLAEDEQQGGS